MIPRRHASFFFTRTTYLVACLIFAGQTGLVSALAQTNSAATNIATNIATNLAATDYTQPLVAPSLPDTGLSFIRVIGALALVLGLFLGGVWLFRNWQKLRVKSGAGPKLNVLETRSLGGRHAIYVIGYENERYLVASSPTGVNLLSHLPAATEGPAGSETAEAAKTPPTFAQALSQVLKGK